MSSRKDYVVRRIEILTANISRIHANILHQDELCDRLEKEADWLHLKGDGTAMRDTTSYGPEMRAILRGSMAPHLSTSGSRTPRVSRSGGTKYRLIHFYRDFHRPNELKIHCALETEKAAYEAELHKINAKEGTLAEQLEYVAPELKEAREAAVRQQLELDM